MTPTLQRSAAGVTDSSLATSGAQNSGVPYFTIILRVGLNRRAKPKSMTFISSEDGLASRRFSGYKANEEIKTVTCLPRKSESLYSTDRNIVVFTIIVQHGDLFYLMKHQKRLTQL